MDSPRKSLITNKRVLVSDNGVYVAPPELTSKPSVVDAVSAAGSHSVGSGAAIMRAPGGYQAPSPAVTPCVSSRQGFLQISEVA